MALEYIVNGEKGANIFNEYAEKFKIEKFSKSKLKAIIDSIYENIEIKNLDGFTEENLNELNVSIKNIICSKLNESSFGTKLNELIARLSIPVSEDEKNLLSKSRQIRNQLIHGLKMSTISTLEVKKLNSVTSRILIYKLIDQLKEE